jgi:signal transduction histidine kinase
MLATSPPALLKMTESFSSLVFFYDPYHKKIVFSNMPIENFFGTGLSMEEDLPFSSIVETKDTRNIYNEWETCLQLKEKQSHQFWFHKKLPDGSGVIFHFHALGVKMKNDSNPDIYRDRDASCILFTAEKSPEGENAIWMAEFERLQKLLDRYKEEYAEFIDIAAHNLDAPLRKLSVLIERLTTKQHPDNNKDATADEQQAYITRIRTALDDMRSLIDSLATLSRVTTASLKIENAPLETIVEHEWRELKMMTRDKFAILTTSSLPVIAGDALQYRHLFREMLENAMRFSRKDKRLEINISAQPLSGKEKSTYGLPGGTEYYKIICKDNGIGFRQEYAEKIFRPFVRLHGKSEFPGNGIGLALCRSIVDNHRGVIYAESQENEGPRFIILLPQTVN